MKLTLEVISDQQSSMGGGRSFTCDESGGSIGRGHGNAWVLPDPSRYVSSRHAAIEFSDGRFRITDTSTNGVFVNGAADPLGRNRRAVLSNGDRLVVGEYEIEVRLHGDTVAADQAASTVAIPPVRGAMGDAAPESLSGFGEWPDAESRHRRPSIPDAPSPPGTVPIARSGGVRPSSVSQPIPDDADFTVRPDRPRPATAYPRGARAPKLEDLDAMLPDSPHAPPFARLPRAPGPGHDMRHDVMEKRIGGAPEESRETRLPDGVPLVRPVPGTGNRPEPLSPVPAAMSASPAMRAMRHRPDRVAPGAARSSVPRAATAIVTALSTGLDVDRRALEAMTPREIVALAGCTARAARLGIASALDARNTFARALGLDPGVFGPHGEIPSPAAASGETQLEHRLSGSADMPKSLAAAARDSSAALAASAAAVATALETVLDRFETENPPGSAVELRTMLGTLFVELYNRNTQRPK